MQQQNNGHDYRLFTIADMMEFVADRYSGLSQGHLTFSFFPGKMHKHFVKCLEQNYMEPFRKKYIEIFKNIPIKIIELDLFCCCGVPDVPGLGPWIACDICDQWYL